MVKKSRKNKGKKIFAGWKPSPLKGSFMVTAIVGFLISAYYVYPQNLSLGFACMFIFMLMFIAAIISMTKSPVAEY